jgi:alkylated DNA repair dioxygenase AlkB
LDESNIVKCNVHKIRYSV